MLKISPSSTFCKITRQEVAKLLFDNSGISDLTRLASLQSDGQMKTLGGTQYPSDSLWGNIPDVDLYWTPNSFFPPLRGRAIPGNKELQWMRMRERNLSRLQAVFVDLDTHKVSSESTEDILPKILYTLGEHLLPAPHFAVHSGRGLHLYWLLEPISARESPETFWESVTQWKSCAERLVSLLKSYGADGSASTRPSGLLRVPDTRNSRVEVGNPFAWAVAIATEQPKLRLAELSSLLPKAKPGETNRPGFEINPKVKKPCPHPEHAKSLALLQQARQADLRALLEDRLAKSYDWEGMRNNFLFIWNQVHGRSCTVNELLAINHQLHNSLPDNETNVRSITLHKLYRIRNRKIIRDLQITENEMKRLSLRTLVSSRISYERRRAKQPELPDGRHARAEKTRATILDAASRGLSHEDIAEATGISLQTVYRVLPKGRKKRTSKLGGVPPVVFSQNIDRSDVSSAPPAPPFAPQAGLSVPSIHELSLEMGELEAVSSVSEAEMQGVVEIRVSRGSLTFAGAGLVPLVLKIADGYPDQSLFLSVDGMLRSSQIQFIAEDSLAVLRCFRSLGLPAPDSFHDLGIARSVLGISVSDFELDDPGLQSASARRCKPSPFTEWPFLKAGLLSSNLWSVYEDTELPVRDILAEMEAVGLPFDTEKAVAQFELVARQLEVLQTRIDTMVGRSVNMDNAQELEHLLFDELQLPVISRTKKGKRTVDNLVLSRLGQLHDIPSLIGKYRKLKHLREQNIRPVMEALCDDGRVRGMFSASRTATGRLSCREPNLQGLQTADGTAAQFRACFRAEAGKKIVKADYSQIEVRVLAVLSSCTRMLQIFGTGGDVYRFMACEFWGIQVSEVTSEQRRVAKELTLAILYGLEEFGLSKKLGISIDYALELILTFHKTFPEVRVFKDRLVKNVQRDGFIEIPGGRRRYFHPSSFLTAKSRKQVSREILNTVVQGLAAKLVKMAMIELHELASVALGTPSLVLQVHDELVFEVEQDHAHGWALVVQSAMQMAGDSLGITSPVEVKVTSSWS